VTPGGSTSGSAWLVKVAVVIATMAAAAMGKADGFMVRNPDLARVKPAGGFRGRFVKRV